MSVNAPEGRELTINVKGHLYSLSKPRVMGIVNVTPDSFYAGSRTSCVKDIKTVVERMLDEGVDIFDLGGYSTRPGASEVDASEEYNRLASGLEVVRNLAPDVPVSVDTFRASVARRCVEEWGADIINDIGGGTLDSDMFQTVADLKVTYVLMHMRGTPATMQTFSNYQDVIAEVIADLSRKVFTLHGLGVNDIIIDPGFGFAKNVSQNFRLLDELDEFCRMGMPVLAGLSRKSMIWKTLECGPEDALEGTVALNMIALERGANILRVHDVRAARETIALHEMMKNSRLE